MFKYSSNSQNQCETFCGQNSEVHSLNSEQVFD